MRHHRAHPPALEAEGRGVSPSDPVMDRETLGNDGDVLDRLARGARGEGPGPRGGGRGTLIQWPRPDRPQPKGLQALRPDGEGQVRGCGPGPPLRGALPRSHESPGVLWRLHEQVAACLAPVVAAMGPRRTTPESPEALILRGDVAMAASGLVFEDTGEHEPRGIPDPLAPVPCGRPVIPSTTPGGCFDDPARFTRSRSAGHRPGAPG